MRSFGDFWSGTKCVPSILRGLASYLWKLAVPWRESLANDTVTHVFGQMIRPDSMLAHCYILLSDMLKHNKISIDFTCEMRKSAVEFECRIWFL